MFFSTARKIRKQKAQVYKEQQAINDAYKLENAKKRLAQIATIFDNNEDLTLVKDKLTLICEVVKCYNTIKAMSPKGDFDLGLTLSQNWALRSTPKSLTTSFKFERSY